jgi:hypothetical protein
MLSSCACMNINMCPGACLQSQISQALFVICPVLILPGCCLGNEPLNRHSTTRERYPEFHPAHYVKQRVHIIFVAESRDTVLARKSGVNEVERFLVDRQCLFLQMNSGFTLIDCATGYGSTVHVVLQLRGQDALLLIISCWSLRLARWTTSVLCGISHVLKPVVCKGQTHLDLELNPNVFTRHGIQRNASTVVTVNPRKRVLRFRVATTSTIGWALPSRTATDESDVWA